MRSPTLAPNIRARGGGTHTKIPGQAITELDRGTQSNGRETQWVAACAFG